ncbi:MAG: hypothetical protein V2I43_11475, partial [Parvularcula sp.]|nr:hypothetical protein [Parvularcula sp.]
HAELARDGRDAEPLPLQIVDQDDLSQCDHLPAPPFAGQQVGCCRRRRSAGGMPPADRRTGAQTGDFSNGTSGEVTLGTYTLWLRLGRLVMLSPRSRHHADLAQSIHSTGLCRFPEPALGAPSLRRFVQQRRSYGFL